MTDPLAWHEAGHWCALYLLNGVVAPVLSIRPSPGHQGAVILGPRPPLDRSDPDARVHVEREIVGLLAGRAAERLARLQSGTYRGDPPPGEAERLAESLGPRDVELLHDAEVRTSFVPIDEYGLSRDDTATFDIAAWYSDEPSALIGWLGAVAVKFCARHLAVIDALARELVVRQVMSGADAASIVNQARASEPEEVTAA